MSSLMSDRDPFLCELLQYVFVLAIIVIWVYLYSHMKNLFTSMSVVYQEDTAGQHSGTPVAGDIEPGKEPHVTVQICTYNEGDVVPATIAHACSIDWPKGKLHIQVCDDSTEQDSIESIKESVALWRSRGADVVRLSRPDRIGYKAGNLRYNFHKIKGDYVAYLDADHRAEKDFLKNIIPYFFDRDGKPKTKIALVQAPWGYYNTHQNLLTECDALGLDIHHMVDQLGKATLYGVFGFNGTGGVWHKRAVADAGGFTWDTVTEDIYLAYHSHMKGYDFVYARQYPQLLEVPSGILAHIQQKSRWSKGFLQVFRLYSGSILSSSKLSNTVKFEMLMHILAPGLLVAALVILLVYPYVVASLTETWHIRWMAIAASMVPLLEAIHAIFAKVSGSNGHYNTLRSRVARLIFIVPYYTLRLGMSMFEAKALLEGLLSDDATFHTTPKEGSETNSIFMKARLAEKVKRQLIDDLTAWIGILFAVYQIFVYGWVLQTSDITDAVLHRSILCWCFVHVVGLLCVSTAFLWEKHQPSRDRAMGILRSWYESLFALDDDSSYASIRLEKQVFPRSGSFSSSSSTDLCPPSPVLSDDSTDDSLKSPSQSESEDSDSLKTPSHSEDSDSLKLD